MKKLSAAFLSVFILIFSACGDPYGEKDFLGKTSAEIVAEYGEFDCISMPADEDGLYRNCRCGYTVKPAKSGFLTTSPEVLFFIVFDSDGIAVACEKGHRPGG